jgi:hypothetical protein
MGKIPALMGFLRIDATTLPGAATVQAPVHKPSHAKPLAKSPALALTSALPIRSSSMASATHRRSPRIATVLLLLAAALAAGCGSTHTSGTAADPASFVPASAPLYLGATVRPDGALKTDALAAGGTLTHQSDPYLRLLSTLQTPGSPPLDFGRDVAPWLGSQGGIFLSSLSSSGKLLSILQQGLLGSSSARSAWPFSAQGGAQGAIVLDARDIAKARSFITAQAKRAGAHTAGYKSVTYYAAPSGVAFAIVEHIVAIGSVAGVRDVIDTSLGNASLARSAGYTKLLAATPSGALAHLYSNPGASTAGGTSGSATPSGSGDASQPSGTSGLSSLLALLVGTREANLSLVPSSTSLALDADTLSSGSAARTGGLLSSGATGTQALGELPAESWLAAGLGEVGASLGPDVQSLGNLLSLGTPAGAGGPPESAASGGFTVKGVLEGIVTPLNALAAGSAEAKRAFQSWMGPASLFASGTGVVNLRAAIAIVSHNPAGSRAAVAKLATLLSKGESSSAQSISISGTDAAISARVSGLPVELDIADGRAADGQTKFVIGLGEASVQDALNPPSKLSGSAPLSTASAALGEGARPSLTVAFPELLTLLEGVGLSEDPSISGLLPDLRTLSTLAGGSHDLGGGIERTRIVVGLQGAG